MGAVVTEQRVSLSSKQVTSFQVVDGQQRLTTFLLYLAAARDYASQARFETNKNLIEGYLFNDKEHLMENPEVDKFKVWPTKYDRDLFMDILSMGRKNLRDKYRQYFYKSRDKVYTYSTVPNLLGAYGYFFDQIKNAVERDELEDGLVEEIEEFRQENPDKESSEMAQNSVKERRLEALWEALTEEFKVVEITLEEGDDAQVIFETLNERGEPLLAADLVRNNIFHRADANKENADQLFNDYWKEFEDPFWDVMEKQGRYSKKRIEFFLANFIAGKIAGEVTISKLFSEYKAYIKAQRNDPEGGYVSVKAELQDLVGYAKLYRRLLERDSSDPLGLFANQLQPWDVTTVYPLVLRLWARKEVDEENKVLCLSILLTFIVRRAICGLTTKNYNKFFLYVLRHLDANNFQSETLVQFLVGQRSESAKLPSDEEFERSWNYFPMYENRLSSLRVRSVLEAIERKKRQAKYCETDHFKADLTVEHILPVSWQDHWPLPDGSSPTREEIWQAEIASEEDGTPIGLIARRQRLLHTFGNLTILTKPLNSHVRNSAFTIKRQALKEHSVLVSSCP